MIGPAAAKRLVFAASGALLWCAAFASVPSCAAEPPASDRNGKSPVQVPVADGQNRSNPDRQAPPTTLPDAPPDVPPPAVIPRNLPRRSGRSITRLDEDSPDRPPLAVDRQTLKEMDAAGELIARQQYPEALHHLQRVLDSPEDSWLEVTGPKGPIFQSAKREAADRIGTLPPGVRESYETEFGPTARQLLDDATRRNGSAQLSEVVGRYFHTRAGYRAAYTLGNRLFDESLLLPAARQFERLRMSPGGAAFEPWLSLKEAYCWLRVGENAKSAAILSAIKQRPGGDTLTLGGQRATIPEGHEALNWLARLIGPSAADSAALAPRDWLFAGGEPDRDAPGGNALPLGDAVWTQSLIRDHDLRVKDRFAEIEKALEDYRNDLAESDSLTIPSGSPLVIGNAAVFRTFARLRAVELRTGQPLWDFADRDRLYGILAAARSTTRRANRLPVSMESHEQDELRLFLNARAFRDQTYAGLSSDGERVFAVFDGGFLGLEEPQKNERVEGLGARNHNVLGAIDLATGRLLWELGGTRSDRNRDLAGTFFLGCGLPIGSTLYVLGELDGDVSLFKIDAATGRRLATQRLATPLGRLPVYAMRRLAGANPSAAAGLLICPTTGGVVTAYDPASRTLVWEYRYRVNRIGDPRTWMDDVLETGDDERTRWIDSAPVIVDGAVLLTPRDSDDLHCLNLADGTLRWTQPRLNRLFVAGALDGVVYLVGRMGLDALNLKDGSDAWNHAVELSLPAGRGYRHGNLYHLPLSSGDLATIDLRRGRILTRTRFSKNAQPGNLVSAEGAVVMQSAGSVQGFPPTAELEQQIAKTLEQAPDDAAALAARGELRLHRGKTDAGLADLTRSVKLRPDPRTQSIAVATVLESLRFDFAASRTLAERFEPQITDPRQRVEYHRLMAAGLARAGDPEAALDHDLHLLQDDKLGAMLLPDGESLKVQVAQLVAPDLAELFKKTTVEQRERLTKKIESWTGRLAETGQVEQLRRAVGALQSLPIEVELRRLLISRLTSSDQAELVRQLMHLRKSSDEKTAGNATARLARLMLDRHRADESFELLAELGGRFKDVKCTGEETGAKLWDAWSKEPRVKAARARVAPWPNTGLTVKTVSSARPLYGPPQPILFEQRTGSFYRDWRFESRRQTERGFTLTAIDPAGNDRWQADIDLTVFGKDAEGDTPMAVRIHGPLLELALRRRIFLLDAFDGAEAPKILWSRALFDPRWSTANQMRTEIGLTGLLSADRVFYQLGSAACAADLVTGQTVWERRNIAFSYSLVGNEDYVIALSRMEPTEPYGVVLRAANGAEVFGGPLGVRGPLSGEWHGSHVLTTVFTPRRLTRARTDLVARKDEWTLEYSMPAWPISIDENEFGILDAGRTLHIHSSTTGNELFKTDLDHLLHASQLSVRKLGERYIVIRQSGDGLGRFRERPQAADPGGVWAINGDTGKIAWSASVPSPQLLIELPSNCPVLVLLRQISRFETARGGGVGTVITILDARTGKQVYEGREATTADQISVRLDPDARIVHVATDRHRLEISAKRAD